MHERLPERLPPGVFPVRKPHKTYWYYTPNRGKPNEGPRRRLPEQGTPEWDDAIEAIRREQAGTPALYDIRSLVRDYRETARWMAHQRSTRETYEAALKPILQDWRYRRPAEISIADVTALVERLAPTPSMANMTLVMASNLIQFAIRKGLRKDNPVREVEKLAEAEDGAKPLQPPQWAALRAEECPVALRRFAALGRYTGQRISDLLTMRPCDRDEDGISHKIKKLRNKPHWSLLTAEQAAEVDGWNAPPITPYVIRPDGKAYIPDRLRDAWNAYARTEAGKALVGFTPHDLRATKVCDERIAGKTHQQISAMVGMSIPKVMHYSRHIDQRLVARGAGRTEASAPTGPLGLIYDLAEAAAYLRVPTEEVAALARHHGVGAVFGAVMRFNEDDVRALWKCARQGAATSAPLT